MSEFSDEQKRVLRRASSPRMKESEPAQNEAQRIVERCGAQNEALYKIHAMVRNLRNAVLGERCEPEEERESGKEMEPCFVNCVNDELEHMEATTLGILEPLKELCDNFPYCIESVDEFVGDTPPLRKGAVK